MKHFPPSAFRAVFTAFAVIAPTTVPGAAPLRAQDATWNEPAVLDLVSRARDLRHSSSVDSTFRSYQANARGYVYFFFDRPDTGERNLVKADQVALEIYWQAPDQTKQLIVGQRDQKILPTEIRYHLDHLTVVQDDFGDFIRMGDGDEVEAVLHPVGPRAEETYDYLLSDSLTISFANGTVRVYEIRVRPKDFEQPGFVGAIYVDRARAALVRMSFSFTPASYVDPYVDYIRVSLDNSLWLGEHWLPYQQEVEIRREIPLLDVMTGSVIRGRFQIRGYDFNVSLRPTLFAGGRVSAMSPNQRRAFRFERGLFDDLDEEGLTPSPSLAEVRRQVSRVVEDQAMSGLAPLRVHFANLSDFARYNRADGLRLGGGITLRPGGGVVGRVSGGYAFGRERLSGAVSASIGMGPLRPSLDLYWDGLGDIGGHPGATPLENTITSLSGKKDYTDPFFRRGGTLTLRGRDAVGPALRLTWEEHLGARDVVSDDLADTEFRPVRSIEEGVLGALGVHLPLDLATDVDVALDGTLGRLDNRTFGTLSGEALWISHRPGQPWQAEVALAGGAVTDRAPPQSLHLLGGRWTLPGYDYRSFVGDRYWLLRGELTVPVWAPYVGVRAIGAAGATYLGDRTLPADWALSDSDGVRPTLGAGLSFGFDTFRVDLARGLRGGGWEALFSVAREFRSWL
ncbi:MAG TPA: hypothetical protein VMM35_03035 [Longimicrobiales bacterium]|nr:hypothetical protein [Longimicrobiales bacterium]